MHVSIDHRHFCPQAMRFCDFVRWVACPFSYLPHITTTFWSKLQTYYLAAWYNGKNVDEFYSQNSSPRGHCILSQTRKKKIIKSNILLFLSLTFSHFCFYYYSYLFYDFFFWVLKWWSMLLNSLNIANDTFYVVIIFKNVFFNIICFLNRCLILFLH